MQVEEREEVEEIFRTEQRVKQHVIVLLDISYSMYNRKKQMLDGLNFFILSLKNRKDSSDIFLTVVMFADHVYYICKALPVNSVKEYTVSIFPPFGNTHLYDALGTVLQDWIPHTNIRHNLFIITDGLDNGSKIIDKNMASNMCTKAVQEYGWNITDCHVNMSNLDSNAVETVKYDVSQLESLFENLVI